MEWFVKQMHSLLHGSYSFVEERDKTKKKELHNAMAKGLGSVV